MVGCRCFKDNGVSKDYAYGRYLGERYSKFPNVIWFNGNDFQDWRDPALDAGVLAVARGIRSTEPNQLQTVELNFDSSGSLDDRRWRNLIDLDAAYTYFPTYDQILKDYNRSNIPVFMVEAVYEFENIGNHEPGTPLTLRRQAYWSFLSGTTGQLYGNKYTWQFLSGWKSHLDTPGSVQFGYAARLFAKRPWYRLVPDQNHDVVTSGYGAFGTLELRHGRSDSQRNPDDRVHADRGHDLGRHGKARRRCASTMVRPDEWQVFGRIRLTIRELRDAIIHSARQELERR